VIRDRTAIVRVIAPLTSVVTRIHAEEQGVVAWLEGIREAVDAAFEGHLGAMVYQVRLDDDANVSIDALSQSPLAPTMMEAMQHAGARGVSAYRSGPVMHATRLTDAHPARSVCERDGVRDILTAIGMATPRLGAAISLPTPAAYASFPREARTAAARLSAHLAAALRLRASRPDDEAVLSSDGTLLDARGEASDDPSRARLRSAALEIARAKREAKSDPAGALAFWKAMVDGRWTLVERTERDGKRLLIARRNTPGTRAGRALTERERAVLERASYGSPLCHVAYELGLAPSTVSETLARAMRKLGLKNRAELVQLHASLVGPQS
jgi:DNA-binding CsgD family transcriptional regulator